MSRAEIGADRLHGVVLDSQHLARLHGGGLALRSIVTAGPQSALNRTLVFRLPRHDLAALLAALAAHPEYRGALAAALDATGLHERQVSPRIAAALGQRGAGMSPTYRFYSIGQAPATSPRAGAWIVLGWSRTREAAAARPGARYLAHAYDRPHAARVIKRQYGIEVDTRK